MGHKSLCPWCCTELQPLPHPGICWQPSLSHHGFAGIRAHISPWMELPCRDVGWEGMQCPGCCRSGAGQGGEGVSFLIPAGSRAPSWLCHRSPWSCLGAVLGEAPQHCWKVLFNQLPINGGLWFYLLVVACVSPRWRDPLLPPGVLAAFGPIFGGFRKDGGVWELLSMHEVAAALQSWIHPRCSAPAASSSRDSIQHRDPGSGGSLLCLLPLPLHPVLPARACPPVCCLPAALQETRTEPD